MALNLRTRPGAVKAGAGRRRLRDMTRAYFSSGGMDVRYSIVSAENRRRLSRRTAAALPFA